MSALHCCRQNAFSSDAASVCTELRMRPMHEATNPIASSVHPTVGMFRTTTMCSLGLDSAVVCTLLFRTIFSKSVGSSGSRAPAVDAADPSPKMSENSSSDSCVRDSSGSSSSFGRASKTWYVSADASAPLGGNAKSRACSPFHTAVTQCNHQRVSGHCQGKQ